MRFKTLALLLLTSPAFGQSMVIDHFLGQNDSDPSVALQPSEAQAALNVESSLTGYALKKRDGYTRIASLAISTSAPTGTFSFVDTSGNKQDVVCYDHACAKSTNNSAFSVFLSTAGGTCMPTRWSFTAIAGSLYAANDCHDILWKYNGTTLTSFDSNAPLGSILESSKDRLIVSGVSASPNTVYYSQSGTYTNFLIGVNSADPYTDAIGASGDAVKALKWSMGRLFLFKTTSITSCVLGDQYTSQCFPVANTIGTSDPNSVVEIPGGLVFKGSDKNFWKLDDSGLTIISRKIATLIGSQATGSQNSNTQNNQADWTAGVQIPTGTWNTSINVGSIMASSVTFVDTSNADFSSGTFDTHLTTITTPNAIQISSQPYFIYNGGFETGDLTYWTCATTGAGTCGVTATSPISGTYSGYAKPDNLPSSLLRSVTLKDSAGSVMYQIQDNDTSSMILATGVTLPSGCTKSNSGECIIDLATNGLSTQTLKIIFSVSGSNPSNTATLTSSTFTAISSVSWRSNADPTSGGWAQLDDVKVNRYFDINNSSAVFQYSSKFFNMGASTTTAGPLVVSSSVPQGTSITFQTRSIRYNGTYTPWSTVTNGSRMVETGQYYQYLSSFTTQVGTQTPVMQDVTLVAATTGQYVTQCIQPGTGITSLGQLSCAQTTAGNGSLVYYATSAATCATLPATQPSSWQTSVTNNATLSISTNAAMYIGFRSLLTSATDQAQVDACTVYWTNGSAVQPSWGTYDPIRNAVYWTVTLTTATSSNRVLKYDLNLNEWYPFGLNATAIYRNTNGLYFGDSTGGYWNLYGGVNSDNGSAINAYWKSKDFGNGTNPFVDNSYTKLSLIAKNQGSGTMSVTYNLSDATSQSQTVSLSTGSTVNYVHANFNIPRLSPTQFMNIQLGNNSSVPFEIDGVLLESDIKTWQPRNP